MARCKYKITYDAQNNEWIVWRNNNARGWEKVNKDLNSRQDAVNWIEYDKEITKLSDAGLKMVEAAYKNIHRLDELMDAYRRKYERLIDDFEEFEAKDCSRKHHDKCMKKLDKINRRFKTAFLQLRHPFDLKIN